MIRPISITLPRATDLGALTESAELRDPRRLRAPKELAPWLAPPTTATLAAPQAGELAAGRRVEETLERQLRDTRHADDASQHEVEARDNEGGESFDAALQRERRAAGDEAEAGDAADARSGRRAAGSDDAEAAASAPSSRGTRASGALPEGADPTKSASRGAAEGPEAPAAARRAGEAAAPTAEAKETPANARAAADSPTNVKVDRASTTIKAEVAQTLQAAQTPPAGAATPGVNTLTPEAAALNAELARVLGLTGGPVEGGAGDEGGSPEGLRAAIDAGALPVDAAAARTVSPGTQRVDPAQAARDLGAQITEAVQHLTADAEGDRVIRLHSAELGRFSAIVRSDGRDLTVHLLADESAARAALAARAHEVRDALVRAQVTPGEVDVRADGGGAGRDRDRAPADTEPAAVDAAPTAVRPRTRRPQSFAPASTLPDAVRGRTVDLIA